MAELEKPTAPVNVTERPLTEQEATRSDSPPVAEGSSGSFVDDWYVWEVGGVVLSAACIMTIVGLLLWLDGKKNPSWGFKTPEKTINGRIIPEKVITISLNSVISWISTVGKICILIPITKGLGQLKWVWFAQQERRLDDLEKFDSATRGLTGSARLLWRLRGRHFATVGALAIILALGFDPFIQNLLHYDIVYVPNPDFAPTMKVTPVYDYPGVFGELEPVTKGTIFNGLYSMGQSYRVPEFICSTGNCTFPAYETLGIGVHCVDLTPELARNCGNGTNVDPGLGTACDYSLSNGMALGNTGRTVLALNMSREAIHYSNYSNPLAIVQTIAAFNTEYVDENSVVQASECVVFPSVKTFDSSVGEHFSVPWNANNTDGSKLGLLMNTPEQYLQVMTKQFEEYTYVAPTNESDPNPLSAGYFLYPPPSPGNASAYGSTSEYRMSNQAVVSLQSYFRTFLQGFVRSNGTSQRTYISELNANAKSEALQAIYNGAADLQGVFANSRVDACDYTPNFWGDFANNTFLTNVQCSLDSIATALTVMMQSAQNVTMIPGSSGVMAFGYHLGQGIAPENHVKVTWGWIVLPILIWILSVAMLIGTAVKSKRAKVYLWRTNPLAMVFMRLGRDERQELQQHGGLNEDGLIKRAENIKVQLVVNNDQKDILLRKPTAAVTAS